MKSSFPFDILPLIKLQENGLDVWGRVTDSVYASKSFVENLPIHLPIDSFNCMSNPETFTIDKNNVGHVTGILNFR